MKMKKFWIFLWTFCGFIQFVILESISDVRSSSETKELFSSSQPDNNAIFTATKSLAEYEMSRNSFRTNFGFSNSLSSSDWVESVSVINNSLILTKHNVTSLTSLKRQPTSTLKSEPEASITEIEASDSNNPPLPLSPVFWITFDPLGQDISTISFKRRLQTELAALVTDILRTDRRTRREINDSITIEVEEIKSDGPNKGEATFVIKQNGEPVSAELAGEILGRLTPEELDQYLDVKVLEPLTIGTTSSSYEATLNLTSTVFENSITESSISNRETSSSSVAVFSEKLLEKSSMFDETPKISSEFILQSFADTKVTADTTVSSNTPASITETLETQIMPSSLSTTAHIITSLDLSISSLFKIESSKNSDTPYSKIGSLYSDRIQSTQTFSEPPTDQSVSQQTQSLYQRPPDPSVISINPSPVLQTSEIQDQSKSVINSITPSLEETPASDVPYDPVIDSSSVSSSSSPDIPSVLRDNHASDNISDSMLSISTHDVVSNSVILEQDTSAMDAGTGVQSVERTRQSTVDSATSSIVIQPSSISDYSKQNNDISSFYTHNAMPIFSADVVEISEESSLMSSNISPSETLLDNSQQHNEISSFYTQNVMPVFSTDVVEIPEHSSSLSSTISPTQTLIENSHQNTETSTIVTEYVMPVFSADVVEISEESSPLSSTISPTTTLLKTTVIVESTPSSLAPFIEALKSSDVLLESSEMVQLSSREVQQSSEEVQPSSEDVQPPSEQMQPSSEDVQPSSEQVQPSSEDVQPSSEQVQPSSEDVQPSSEQVQPSSEEVQQSSETKQPSSEVIQPSSEVVQPSSGDLQPSSEVIQPSSEVVQQFSEVTQASSEVKVQPSSKQVQPSSEAVQPSSKQVQPSSEAVQPSSEVVQPSSEVVQSSSEVVQPSSEVVQPSSKDLQPSSEVVQPSSEDVQPSSEVIQPSSEVVQSSSAEARQSIEVTQPFSEVIQPSSDVAEQSSKEVQPSTEAAQLSSEVIQPSSEAVDSSSVVVQPSSEDVQSSSEMVQPSIKVEQSSSEVVQPSSEDEQPSSEEVQPSSEVVQPSSEYVQPSSEFVQPSSEYVQPSSEVVQSSIKVVQSSSEDVQPSSELIQSYSEIVQSSSEAVQPYSEVIQTSIEDLKTSSDVVQLSSDDVQPSSEDVQPSSEDVQPSSEEVHSSSEQIQLSSEDVQPSSEEVPSSSEVVQSHSEEIQPSSEVVQSSSDVIQPFSELVKPSSEYVQPSSEVVQPSSEYVQPSSEVVQSSIKVEQSSSEDVQPSSEVIQSSSEAVQPSSEVVQSSSEDVQPSSEVVQPSSEDLKTSIEVVQPSSEEVQPSSVEVLPSSEEVHTSSENLQPSSEVVQPSSDDYVQPSSEEVQPSREEIQPSSEEVQPSNELVQPSSEQMQPSSGEVQPSYELVQLSSEQMQPSSEEVQPSSVEVQPSNELVQTSSEQMQPSSEEVQASSVEVQPSNELVKPSSEQIQPFSEKVQPSSIEVQPSYELVQPSSEQMQPFSEEEQPSSEQMQPSSVEVQPSSVEVQPSNELVQPSSEQMQPSSVEIQPSSEAVQPSSVEIQPSSEDVQPSSREIQPLQSSDEVVQSTEESISNDNVFETSQGATPIIMETEQFSSETILLSDMEKSSASTISQLPNDNISPSTVLPSGASVSYSDTSPVSVASSPSTELQPSSSKISPIRIPSSSSDTTQSMPTEINIDMSKYLLKFTIDSGGQDTGSEDFRDTLKMDLERLLATGDDKLKVSRRRRAVEPSVAVDIKSIQDVSTGKTEVQFIVTRDNKPIPNDEILSILGQLSAEEIQQIMEFEIVEPITAVQPSSSTIVNSENNPDSTVSVTKPQEETSVTDAKDLESIPVSTKSDITSPLFDVISISTTVVETAELSSVSTHPSITPPSLDGILMSTPEVEESPRMTLSSSVTSSTVLSSLAPSSVIDNTPQDTISPSSTFYTSDVSEFETDLEVGSSLLESSTRMSLSSTSANTLTMDELAPSTVTVNTLQDITISSSIIKSSDVTSDVSEFETDLEVGSSLLESNMSLLSTPANTLTVDESPSLAASTVTLNTLQDITISSSIIKSSDVTSDEFETDLEVGSSLLESSMSLPSTPTNTLTEDESTSLAPSAVTDNILQDITFPSSMLNSSDDTSDVSVSIEDLETGSSLLESSMSLPSTPTNTLTLDELSSLAPSAVTDNTLQDITLPSSIIKSSDVTSDVSEFETDLEVGSSLLESSMSLPSTPTNTLTEDESTSLAPSAVTDNTLQDITVPSSMLTSSDDTSNVSVSRTVLETGSSSAATDTLDESPSLNPSTDTDNTLLDVTSSSPMPQTSDTTLIPTLLETEMSSILSTTSLLTTVTSSTLSDKSPSLLPSSNIENDLQNITSSVSPDLNPSVQESGNTEESMASISMLYSTSSASSEIVSSLPTMDTISESSIQRLEPSSPLAVSSIDDRSNESSKESQSTITSSMLPSTFKSEELSDSSDISHDVTSSMNTISPSTTNIFIETTLTTPDQMDITSSPSSLLTSVEHEVLDPTSSPLDLQSLLPTSSKSLEIPGSSSEAPTLNTSLESSLIFPSETQNATPVLETVSASESIWNQESPQLSYAIDPTTLQGSIQFNTISIQPNLETSQSTSDVVSVDLKLTLQDSQNVLSLSSQFNIDNTAISSIQDSQKITASEADNTYETNSYQSTFESIPLSLTITSSANTNDQISVTQTLSSTSERQTVQGASTPVESLKIPVTNSMEESLTELIATPDVSYEDTIQIMATILPSSSIVPEKSLDIGERDVLDITTIIRESSEISAESSQSVSKEVTFSVLQTSLPGDGTSLITSFSQPFPSKWSPSMELNASSLETITAPSTDSTSLSTASANFESNYVLNNVSSTDDVPYTLKSSDVIDPSPTFKSSYLESDDPISKISSVDNISSPLISPSASSTRTLENSKNGVSTSNISYSDTTNMSSKLSTQTTKTFESSFNLEPTETSSTLLKESSVPIISPTAPQTTVEIAPSKSPFSSATLPTTVAPPDLSKYLVKLVFDPDGKDISSDEFKQQLSLNLLRAFKEALKKFQVQRRKRQASEPKVDVNIRESSVINDKEAEVSFYFTVDEIPIIAPKIEDVFASLTPAEMDQITGVRVLQPISSVNPITPITSKITNNNASSGILKSSTIGPEKSQIYSDLNEQMSRSLLQSTDALLTASTILLSSNGKDEKESMSMPSTSVATPRSSILYSSNGIVVVVTDLSESSAIQNDLSSTSQIRESSVVNNDLSLSSQVTSQIVPTRSTDGTIFETSEISVRNITEDLPNTISTSDVDISTSMQGDIATEIISENTIRSSNGMDESDTSKILSTNSASFEAVSSFVDSFATSIEDSLIVATDRSGSYLDSMTTISVDGISTILDNLTSSTPDLSASARPSTDINTSEDLSTDLDIMTSTMTNNSLDETLRSSLDETVATITGVEDNSTDSLILQTEIVNQTDIPASEATFSFEISEYSTISDLDLKSFSGNDNETSITELESSVSSRTLDMIMNTVSATYLASVNDTILSDAPQTATTTVSFSIEPSFTEVFNGSLPSSDLQLESTSDMIDVTQTSLDNATGSFADLFNTSTISTPQWPESMTSSNESFSDVTQTALDNATIEPSYTTDMINDLSLSESLTSNLFANDTYTSEVGQTESVIANSTIELSFTELVDASTTSPPAIESSTEVFFSNNTLNGTESTETLSINVEQTETIANFTMGSSVLDIISSPSSTIETEGTGNMYSYMDNNTADAAQSETVTVNSTIEPSFTDLFGDASMPTTLQDASTLYIPSINLSLPFTITTSSSLLAVELNSSTPVVEASTDLEINMTSSSDVISIDDSTMILLSNTLTVGEIQESSILPGNGSSSIGSIESSMLDLSSIDKQSTVDSSFTGITTSLANFDTSTASVSMFDLNSSDITSIWMDTMISEDLTIEPTISIDISQDLSNSISNETSATSSYIEIEPSIQTTIEPDSTMTQSDQSTVIFPSNATDIISSDILMPNATMPSSETSISQDLDSSSSVDFSSSNSSIASSVPETSVTASQADGSDLETTSSFVESTTTLLSTPTLTTSSDIISISTITSSNASDFEAITSKIPEPTASSTSITSASTLVPISPISATTESLSLPNIPITPTNTLNPKPTVSSTSIIPTSTLIPNSSATTESPDLSLPNTPITPTSTLNPKPTVSSTSIIPTSTLVPSSSVTVTTTTPGNTTTSPPIYTPTEDDIMVLEISVKLEKDVNDETFQRELETGLMKVFQEASQLGSRKKRSPGNVKFVFKRDVQNAQGVAVTKIERDPSKTQEVKSEFYLVENGQIVSADTAVPIFNRFNNADKSAILGYSALGPVRSLKAGDPAPTTEPEDQTTVLFIVSIVLPCCLVLILIIILIKCYVTNACKNQSIMDYKRGESLEDHNLAVDMEKGDIISGRSSTNSQILPEEYSPRTDRKVPIRNRESPRTSMGNNNSMSKRQSVRESSNRKTVPQQHAERQTHVPSGQNAPVSRIDQPDIPMSEIPSPKRQSTDELSLHDEVFHATEAQTHERAPRHTRRTSNRDSTRKERTSRSSVGRDESPRKRKESKSRKSSRSNPKDYYYQTMKRNDPSFDGSEHTDASEEFTILVPKSQEKRHFEGHTNQIFFDSVVPATDISPTTRHPKGNRLEKQLKVIESPKTKKKPRSQISSGVEFDPCFSPQCSIVEELEVDTPGSTYPTNNFGREYSDVDPYYHTGGVPSSHAMTSIRFDSETNLASSDQIPINGQSFIPVREFAEYPSDINPYYYGDSLRAGPNQPVHPVIQQPLQAAHINQQSMAPVGYSNQFLMSENIPTTSIAVGPDVSTVTADTQTSDHEMVVTAEEDRKLAGPIPYFDPEMKDMKTQTSRDVGAQMDKVEEISILPRTTTKSGPSITVEAGPTVQDSQPHQLPGEVPVPLMTTNQYPVPTPRKPRSPISSQTRPMYHVPNAQDLLNHIDPSSVPQHYFQNEPQLHPYPEHHQHLPSFYPNPMEMQQTRLTGQNGVPHHPDFRYTGDYMSPYPPVSLNNPHQSDRMNTSLYSQPVVHSRMARFNPYEEIQPEPPAVRYQLVPEPNYLIQPEFPPLDAGIQPPEGEALTFYQEPFRQEKDKPDSQSSPTRYRQTPPLYTSEYDKDGEENEDIVQLLQAAETGNLKDVIKFINKLEDVNASNKNGLTPLHVASKAGHVNIVDTLLERGANIHAVTKKGNTALSMASLEGHLEVVKLLIANFAKVNTQSQEGFTPLYMASQEGHEEIVCYLLTHGANQHIPTKNGFTPLAVALQQGHEPVVSLLIEQGSKGKIHLPTHHESEDDRSSSQRAKSSKKRHQSDARDSSPRQRKHHSPRSNKEDDSYQQSSTHSNSSRTKPSKKSRHRDSDNSEKSSPRRSKGDNSQSKNRRESSSRSRSRESTPVKRDRKEKSRHRDSDNSEKSSPRRSKGDNSQSKNRRESSSRSRSRESTPVKRDRKEKSSRRSDKKKEETYQMSAFPKVGRSDLTDDLSDRSSPRQLTDDDKYEQSTRRTEKKSPRSDTSSRNSTPRKQYSDSEDGDRSQYSDKNNSDNEDQYSEDSFYSDSENGGSKPSTPRQEKTDKEGRKSRVSKTQKGDYSDEESDGDVSDGSTVPSSRQDDSQRSPSRSNSKRNSENGDGDSSHGDSQSERSHSDMEDDENASSKKIKPERNRYYNEDVSPRSRNIHFEDEIPIESNQSSDRSKTSKKSTTRKDPQDLYSQIKSEMLKSFKDLNRKTAKNMPDRVENLTDDQLLLLYEFHRRRLLFQGRQEASVKAKVMFNETFLTEEIRRLKKQQQDAKKKMKEILDDAFPTTCVEKF